MTKERLQDAETSQLEPKQLSLIDLDHCRLSFGERIRDLRRSRVLSTRQLAERAALSQSRVVRIESAHVIPTASDLEFILDALAATSLERWEVKADHQTLVSAEKCGFDVVLAGTSQNLPGQIEVLVDRSREIRVFTSACVPGLLQTPEYASAIWAEDPGMCRDWPIADGFAIQQVLLNPMKQFTVLMTEAALRARFVDAKGMALQYRKIANLTSLSNVDIGIVPFTTRVVRPANAWTMYDETYITVDAGVAMLGAAWPEVIQRELNRFEAYCRGAVWNGDARQFLQDMAAELEDVVPIR